MKKIWLVPLIALGVSFSTFTFATCSASEIVSVVDLTKQDVSRLMQENSSGIIVAFPTQAILPLQLFLKGDLISLVENESPLHIQVNQTFYLCCEQGSLFFSSDLKEWKPFLEFASGAVSIGLEVEDGQAFIKIGAETHLKS